MEANYENLKPVSLAYSWHRLNVGRCLFFRISSIDDNMAMTEKQRLYDVLESISDEGIADVLAAYPSLRRRLAKVMGEKPFAYVSQKPCGCIDMAMTSDYAGRKFSDDGINDMVSRGFIRPVGVEEYNRLKMKCDSCYRR